MNPVLECSVKTGARRRREPIGFRAWHALAQQNFTRIARPRSKPSFMALAMHQFSASNGGRMTTGKRGFASMDRNRQREIASKGGKLAHLRGMAHEWTSEEAREAGRKGGAAVRQRKPAPDPQRPDQQ